MARKVTVILVDDVDGGEAEGTVIFGIDGTDYEIDLNSDNEAKFREELAPWIESARRLPKNRTRKRAAANPGKTKEIRAWAQENGYEVSSRGRVPAEIVEAYEKVH